VQISARTWHSNDFRHFGTIDLSTSPSCGSLCCASFVNCARACVSSQIRRYIQFAMASGGRLKPRAMLLTSYGFV